MLTFKDFLDQLPICEGDQDKNIFHAIIMAGPPGAGKSTVIDKVLGDDSQGWRNVDSDRLFEPGLDRAGLSRKMPDEEAEARRPVRAKAKKSTDLMQNLTTQGRNGIIINGTGADPEKYHAIKRHLESLGYKTHMVFVNVTNDVSRQRNIERGKRPDGRLVPEHIRQDLFNMSQSLRGHYKRLFGDDYHEIDNNLDLNTASEEEQRPFKQRTHELFKHFRKHVMARNYSQTARDWIKAQRLKRSTRRTE